MLGNRLAAVAATLTALVAGVASSGFVEEIRRDFQMGVLMPRQAKSIQVFSGAMGGVQAAPVVQSNDAKRPFQVGDDTFPDFQSAADRACSNQHNACAQQANSNSQSTLSVNDCDKQTEQCRSAASTATTTAFNALVSENADFEFFCDV